jgi:hypothetical protein
LYRETHNAYEILCREGKNRAVHSLPTAFIKICEESARSCHGLRSLSNVYELYRRTVSYSSSGIVSVGVNNNCGPSGSYDTQYVNVFGYCGYSLSLSPNPAFNEVTVTINEPERELNEVNNAPINLDILTSNIIITDRVGIVYGTFQKKSRTFTVSVENLKNGNYILTVVIGNFRISAPFIVSH